MQEMQSRHRDASRQSYNLA